MKLSTLLRATLAALTLLAAGCATDPNALPPDNPLKPEETRAREQRLAADALYKAARQSLDSSDFNTAVTRYNQIALRFPFSDFATQADLEKVYALYRNYQPEQALSAADKFLKEHPRHAAADYVQYLKGLINSNRDQGLSGFLGLDTTKEEVSYARRAFDDFSLLTQKYPNSPYSGDARQRMIDLRNQIAQHELHVVRFYVRRGAYVAAAKRAEQIISQYPGAPATLEALQLLEDSYRASGLNDQADDARKLLEAQRAQPPAKSDYPLPERKPGFFGRLFGSKAPSAPVPAAVVEQTPPLAAQMSP